MNANLNLNYREVNENELVSSDCKCSVYSMGTIAAGLLLFLGIVVYALFI